MTAAAQHSIAFRLGRGLGTVVRFSLHDRIPAVRWAKRIVVAAVLLLLLANSISWILSALLTGIYLTLGIYAFSKVDLVANDVDFFKREESYSSIPMQGEYEHPDYYIYHKD